jgi:2-hydroxychromene-2-carboxylate isomerase
MPPALFRLSQGAMTSRFAITWDYRCPFARIANDHVLTALAAGADWDVTFVPISLGQLHREEGDPDVWDEPETDSGLFALQVGMALRDYFPEQFPAGHRAIFEHRHASGGHLRTAEQLRPVLEAAGVDADAVFEVVDTGKPLATIKSEHTGYAASHHVWGVPTFIKDDKAVYVRLMAGPQGDVTTATRTVERLLDLLDWSNLNEFKHTALPS